MDIVNGIVSENAESLACFRKLRDFAVQEGLGFDLQYIIGNHDWLINRYPDARAAVAAASAIRGEIASPEEVA